ncbi:zf-TFIIB domain-containing protein [Tumidithrix elongata RA019]|uniref:Zf-TFIIB domain-containing protein n=1 Tax=Tumidithrix elongata BACA0141 TaxID=2716417 RepID=A0AAW9Q2H7_9CYAN|nr:zf-TFIIB domain-containing protein [Tumidithrix elongata RA019]
MRCPKDKQVQLVASQLSQGLSVCHCSTCEGNWIPCVEYEQWQAQQLIARQESADSPMTEPAFLDESLNFAPAATDAKAGLCPECGSYLARTKISLKQPFYLERCPVCSGIWCDKGEWEVLEKLDLTTKIPQLFSSQWQAQMREKVQLEQERQAVIEKLGTELAQRTFDLADALEKHENGSFAIAYVIRRFDKNSDKDAKGNA